MAMIKNKSKNLEPINYIETTNGTFRVALGDIIKVLPNQVINLRQNITGSHRFAIRFFDINLNQITTGITIPNYASSSFFYNTGLAIWNNGVNVVSRNELLQISANQGIHYVQFGVHTGNVSGIVTATDRLVSQEITDYVPYNDIQVAVGQFEQGQGKNLFDKGVAKYTPSQFYTTTGSIELGGTDSTLDNYVSVLPSTQYTISSGTSINIQRIQYYDNNCNTNTNIYNTC
jgi:hypothetical protein